MDRPRKEIPMAFQPTSNDSLHSISNGANTSNHEVPFPNSILKSESAVLSPSEDSGMMSPLAVMPQTAPTSMALPERESVGSASQLPTLHTASRTDNDSWMDLYYRLIESHKAERECWEAERRQLLRERQKLTDQLGRGAAVRDLDGSVENGVENDKVFYDAATVRHANASLRKLSQSSMRSTGGSIDDDELPNSVRRVSIATGPKVVIGSPGLQAIPEDDPYSPTTTARVMSPVPENFKMDAGHTPMVVRSPRGSSSEAAPIFRPSLGMNDGLDEDKELASPKMLPTVPTADGFKLDTLNQKLQEVAENPDEHPPDALQAPLRESSLRNSDNSSPRSASNRNVVVGPPDAIHDADVGVMLRKKRSSNFGAPFGKLS